MKTNSQKVKRELDLMHEYIEPRFRDRWRQDYQMSVEVARRLRTVGRLMGLGSAMFDIRQDGDRWSVKPANEAASAVLDLYEEYVIEKELQKG